MELSFKIAVVSDFKYSPHKQITLNTNHGKINFKIITYPDTYVDGAICVFHESKNVTKLVKEVRELTPDVPFILASNKHGQLYRLNIVGSMYCGKIIMNDMLLELTKVLTTNYDLQLI